MATTIELDMISGNFDESLVKYRGDRQNREGVYESLIGALKRRIRRRYNDSDKALLSHLQTYGKVVGSPGDADRFFKWLKDKPTTSGEPLAASTLKRYVAILQAVDSATFGHLVVKVPPREAPRPFTKDEVRRILAHFKGSHFEDFILWQFQSGMRTSETIGLRWCDVDLEAGRVTVGQSLKRSLGSSARRVRGTTKTGKTRVIPLPTPLLATLYRRKGSALPEQLVFASPTGKPIDDRNFRRRHWKPALEALGIPYRKPYATRSTCASHLIDIGVPLPRVAALLGHRVETLAKHYAATVGQAEMPDLYGVG